MSRKKIIDKDNADKKKWSKQGFGNHWKGYQKSKPGQIDRVKYLFLFGRDGVIWTLDPSVPNAVLYQTEPRPDKLSF